MILSPILSGLLWAASPAAEAPSGRYVESRTASVFAGACHFGAERTTGGREALLAWSFERGAFRGVGLAGLCVAALIVDEQNLADAAHERRAVVWVPASATAAQREALLAWIGETRLAGRVLDVRSVPLVVAIDDETYAVEARGAFRLAGGALADRACCKMPFDVWYEPLWNEPRVPLAGALVGSNAEFRLEHDRVHGHSWSRPGENAAFFAHFGPARAPAEVAPRAGAAAGAAALLEENAPAG